MQKLYPVWTWCKQSNMDSSNSFVSDSIYEWINSNEPENITQLNCDHSHRIVRQIHSWLLRFLVLRKISYHDQNRIAGDTQTDKWHVEKESKWLIFWEVPWQHRASHVNWSWKEFNTSYILFGKFEFVRDVELAYFLIEVERRRC